MAVYTQNTSQRTIDDLVFNPFAGFLEKNPVNASKLVSIIKSKGLPFNKRFGDTQVAIGLLSEVYIISSLRRFSAVSSFPEGHSFSRAQITSYLIPDADAMLEVDENWGNIIFHNLKHHKTITEIDGLYEYDNGSSKTPIIFEVVSAKNASKHRLADLDKIRLVKKLYSSVPYFCTVQTQRDGEHVRLYISGDYSRVIAVPFSEEYYKLAAEPIRVFSRPLPKALTKGPAINKLDGVLFTPLSEFLQNNEFDAIATEELIRANGLPQLRQHENISDYLAFVLKAHIKLSLSRFIEQASYPAAHSLSPSQYFAGLFLHNGRSYELKTGGLWGDLLIFESGNGRNGSKVTEIGAIYEYDDGSQRTPLIFETAVNGDHSAGFQRKTRLVNSIYGSNNTYFCKIRPQTDNEHLGLYRRAEYNHRKIVIPNRQEYYKLAEKLFNTTFPNIM